MNLFDRTQDITIKRTENHLGGFVYVVKLDNRIKIGVSINPKARIRCIETSAGIVLEKVFITSNIYNASEIESKMLKHTLGKDSIGEWRTFCFDKAIKYINNLDLEFTNAEFDNKTIDITKNKLVIVIKGDKKDVLVTTSKAISEATGVFHSSVTRLIANNLESLNIFGTIRVENYILKSGQTEKVLFLNEQQSTLLVTLMRNTREVTELKINLVKSFYETKKLIQERIS